MGVFLDDQLLDLRCVVERQHHELLEVCAHGLVYRARQGDQSHPMLARIHLSDPVGVVQHRRAKSTAPPARQLPHVDP
jgi:hypothetical protein